MSEYIDKDRYDREMKNIRKDIRDIKSDFKELREIVSENERVLMGIHYTMEEMQEVNRKIARGDTHNWISDRQRDIMILAMFIYHNKTPKEISDIVGLTPQRVNQIINK